MDRMDTFTYKMDLVDRGVFALKKKEKPHIGTNCKKNKSQHHRHSRDNNRNNHNHHNHNDTTTDDKIDDEKIAKHKKTLNKILNDNPVDSTNLTVNANEKKDELEIKDECLKELDNKLEQLNKEMALSNINKCENINNMSTNTDINEILNEIENIKLIQAKTVETLAKLICEFNNFKSKLVR
jgi:hypothetical protein